MGMYCDGRVVKALDLRSESFQVARVRIRVMTIFFIKIAISWENFLEYTVFFRLLKRHSSAPDKILTEDVVLYTEYHHMNLESWNECLKLTITVLPILVTKNRLLSEW